jgi:hypothetical protein
MANRDSPFFLPPSERQVRDMRDIVRDISQVSIDGPGSCQNSVVYASFNFKVE